MRFSGLSLALALAIAGCGGEPAPKNLDTLDDELAGTGTGNAADPLLTSALEDQIMVDPRLAQQANADAVRPPARPYAAPVPPTDIAKMRDTPDGPLLKAPAPAAGECRQCAVAEQSITLGALAERQRDRRTQGCAARLSYAAGWANRLPADVPLHPQARVIEAAGSQGAGCALRAVSFTVPRPMPNLLDWYYTRVHQAGYSAEHQSDGAQHILGGTRGRDGGAYVLFMTERGDGGTDIDLIANNGR